MLAVLLSRRSAFGTSDLILFLNAFVFIIVGTVFGLKGAILSAISYFIAAKVITIVEEGLSGSKSVKIITTEPKNMIETIRCRLSRSATLSKVNGAYSHQEFTEIQCIINRMEERKMKEIIKEIDPQAFVTIYEVVDVSGGNFGKKDIH